MFQDLPGFFKGLPGFTDLFGVSPKERIQPRGLVGNQELLALLAIPEPSALDLSLPLRAGNLRCGSVTHTGVPRS